MRPYLALASLILGSASAAAAPGIVFAFGGGTMTEELHQTFLSYSPSATPQVLIIPHARDPERITRGSQRNIDIFTRLTGGRTTVLDLSDVDAARAAIRSADAIFMTGGSQRRLYRSLNEAGLVDEVRARHAAGIPIGGTSAGAAIMSETMLSGSRTDPSTGEPNPGIYRGLGLWPEVIVDQHFTERNRIHRLRVGVRRNPHLIGVGIDEPVAAVYDGTGFTVVGEGTVTVIRVADPAQPDGELIETILRPGDSFRTRAD
jgi:cyanophycinase